MGPFRSRHGVWPGRYGLLKEDNITYLVRCRKGTSGEFCASKDGGNFETIIQLAYILDICVNKVDFVRGTK